MVDVFGYGAARRRYAFSNGYPGRLLRRCNASRDLFRWRGYKRSEILAWHARAKLRATQEWASDPAASRRRVTTPWPSTFLASLETKPGGEPFRCDIDRSLSECA